MAITLRNVPVAELDPATVAALSARAGDSAAAERLVRLTQHHVWRACLYLTDREHADDLTQETYARAFAGLHRFAARSSVRTWLLAIARNVCADAVARMARERGRPLAVPTPADPTNAVHADLLLDALPAVRREAFVLTQLLGYSYAEAAVICQCAVGTIGSRVARARDDLYRAVTDQPRSQQA